MADTISINELKPGDIMLFSPSDEWISKVIVFLTQSSVSHTGLVDRNPAYLVNEEGDGTIRKMLPDPGERTIYIRRLKNAPDTSVVVDYAMEYVKQKVPYPKSNLVFLGLYIIIGDFIPDTLTGELVKNVVRLACYELIRLANEIQFHDPDKPMVCSQFAAACYDEAALKNGPEYKIHYNEKVTTVPNLIRKIIDQLEKNPEKKYCVEAPEKKHLLGATNHLAEAEDCCKELFGHLTKQKEDHKLAVAAHAGSAEVSDEFIAEIYQFGKHFLKIFGAKDACCASAEGCVKEVNECAGANEMVSGSLEARGGSFVSAEEIKKVLEDLLKYQEAFVTPQDLLVNTTNLEDMGILTYTKDELILHKEKEN
ncbi:MAG: hypothetical protein IK081_03140 [Lachnospiraceae bacterium]|nr:hypothetical protein [Lachnospiraceae bacterium]